MSSTKRKTNVTCDSCGGVLTAKRVDVYRRRRGLRVLFESVPALVCRQCGANVFEASAVEEMERILAKPPKRMRSRKIAVVSSN